MAGIRILRYVLFALLCMIVIFFISSASSTSVSENLQKGWSHYAGAKPGESETTPQKETVKQAVEDAIQGSKGSSKDTKGSTAGSVAGSKDAPKDVPKDSKDSKGSLSGSLSGSSGRKPASNSAQQTFINSKIATGKMNATFVTLARNADLWEIVKSIRQVEDRFNHNYHYDWVFLNEQAFNDEFKKTVSNLVSGKARFGLIGEEHWSFPSWIDQDKAAAVRQDMKERQIIYGDSISYRHMCRFESGFFFRQPLMMEYEWYWRVEPSIKLFCDVPYDTFEFMAKHNKMYSFTLSLYEYAETIPTLWDSVKAFMQLHPEHIAKDNSMDFLSNDGGKTYNHCHFWSNFEIGNLNWLRSDAYIDFFSRLDNDGGFFYERWGDAPVHSIAAGLLLNKDQIHFFDDIAYYHVPFTHCPTDEKTRADRKCSCDPSQNFDWNGYSCTAKYFDLHKMKKPAEYEKKKD